MKRALLHYRSRRTEEHANFEISISKTSWPGGSETRISILFCRTFVWIIKLCLKPQRIVTIKTSTSAPLTTPPVYRRFFRTYPVYKTMLCINWPSKRSNLILYKSRINIDYTVLFKYTYGNTRSALYCTPVRNNLRNIIQPSPVVKNTFEICLLLFLPRKAEFQYTRGVRYTRALLLTTHT